jgi:hypothetical protein
VKTSDGMFSVTQDVDRKLWAQDAGLVPAGPLSVAYDFNPTGYYNGPELTLSFRLYYPDTAHRREIMLEAHGALREGTFPLSTFGCVWTCDPAHPIESGSFCEDATYSVSTAVSGKCAPVEGTLTISTLWMPCEGDASPPAGGCEVDLDAHVQLTQSPSDVVTAEIDLHEVQRGAI